MKNLRQVYEFSFTDERGCPYDGYLMHTYKKGTLVEADTYADREGNLNENPVKLDARGCANFFIRYDKEYRFILTDKMGNIVWFNDDVLAEKTSEINIHGVTEFTADVDSSVGTPSVDVELNAEGNMVGLRFHGLKGQKGDAGGISFVDIGNETISIEAANVVADDEDECIEIE